MASSDSRTQTDTTSTASRRSCLIWAAVSFAGFAGAFIPVAQRVLAFLCGPRLNSSQVSALLKKQEAAIDNELRLSQLKLQRLQKNEIEVCDLGDLQSGQGKLVTDFYLQPALIIQTDSGKVTARSAVCTHLGCTVQEDLVDGKIYCPCHSSYFDVNTGRVLAGPATAPLAEEPLKIANGKVYLVKPMTPVKIGPTQAPGELA